MKSWQLAPPEDYRRGMLSAIMGLVMLAERLEGKFMLSQNRSPAERRRIIAALEASERAADHILGAFMADQAAIVLPETPEPAAPPGAVPSSARFTDP
jgi:predicted FMN-binding regulatory protein PaiB